MSFISAKSASTSCGSTWSTASGAQLASTMPLIASAACTRTGSSASRMSAITLLKTLWNCSG